MEHSVFLIFIYLLVAAPGLTGHTGSSVFIAALRIFDWGMGTLNCIIQDLLVS